MPARHIEFVERLGLMHEAGDYVFVHAGVRPGVAIAEQDPDDLLWIREEFLLSGGTLERPGLQRLLADIEAHRVDLVVVYKVYRLTRSLADCSKRV